MQTLKTNLLARASLGALVVAATFAAAPAQSQVTLRAGGATLVSLVINQLFDCYGNVNPLPTECSTPALPQVGGLPQVDFTYDSVGSGAGQRGWVTQNRRVFSSALAAEKVVFGSSESATTEANINVYNNGGRFSSTSGGDVARRDDTCVVVTPPTGAPASPPAGSTGVDFATTGTNCHDNPRVEAGPAVQVPFLGTSVTVAFDPVYKVERLVAGGPIVNTFVYNFTPRANNDGGGLNLPRDAFCGIFSGQITRWNDAFITAANGGVPVWPAANDTEAQNGNTNAGRNITVVVRDDDSGTTSLFTRALRAQCPAQFTTALPAGSSAIYPGNPGPNSLPAVSPFNATLDTASAPGLTGANGTPLTPAGQPGGVPASNNTLFAGGNFNYARGNEGVANGINLRNPKKNALQAVGGRIGYLSPSFVEPIVSVDPYKGFKLASVDLQNQAGVTARGATLGSVAYSPAEQAFFIAPDAESSATGSTILGLGSQELPENRTDIVLADRHRGNPAAWVANASGANAGNTVANPTAAGAYPIVGSGNLLAYTCYRDQATVTDFIASAAKPGFLNWLFANSSSVRNILKEQGFVATAPALRTAILETLVNGTDGRNLNIRTAPVADTVLPNFAFGNAANPTFFSTNAQADKDALTTTGCSVGAG